MVDTQTFKTYVEEIPGHDCQLDIKITVDEALFGGQYPTRRERMRKILQRSFLVSRKHPHTDMYYKSTMALCSEVVRHVTVNANAIHPFSVFRSNWEIFMIFLFIVTAVAMPFNVGLQKHGSRLKNPFDYIVVVCLALYILDIIVNFHMGYVSKETHEVVLTKKKIILHYVKTWFFFDLITTPPYTLIFIIILKHEYGYYLELLNMLKVIRIFEQMKYYNQMNDRFKIPFVFRRVVATLFVLAFCVHLFACFFFMVAFLAQGRDPKNFDKESWLSYQDLGMEEKPRNQMYRLGLMRAVTNAFGVNFDFRSSTLEDLLSSIIVAIGGVMLTVYIAVQVVLVTRVRQAATVRYEEMQVQLREYVKYKHVPPDLEQRLLDYHRFCYHKMYFQEEPIISFLTAQLKQDVRLHSCKRLVESVPFFTRVPPEVVLRIIACLSPVVVLANDVIMKAGMEGDTMYFIASGTVAVYTATGKEVCHLQDGSHFGEIAVIMKEERTASVVAVETCELYTLRRKDFMEVIHCRLCSAVLHKNPGGGERAFPYTEVAQRVKAVAPNPELLMMMQRVAEQRQASTLALDEQSRDQSKSVKAVAGSKSEAPNQRVRSLGERRDLRKVGGKAQTHPKELLGQKEQTEPKQPRDLKDSEEPKQAKERKEEKDENKEPEGPRESKQ